jgi:hypothetical protein
MKGTGLSEEGYGLQPVQKGPNKNRGLQPPRAAIEVTCGSPGIHPRHKPNPCAAGFSPRGTRKQAEVSTPANPATNPKGLSPGSNPPADPPHPSPVSAASSHQPTPVAPKACNRAWLQPCRMPSLFKKRRGRASWKHGRGVRASWKKGTGFSPYKKVPTKTVGFSPQGRQSTYRVAVRGFIPGTNQTHAPRASAHAGSRREAGVSTPANHATNPKGFSPGSNPPADPPHPSPFAQRPRRTRLPIALKPCNRACMASAVPIRRKLRAICRHFGSYRGSRDDSFGLHNQASFNTGSADIV